MNIQLSNFPLAYSLVGVINAAFALKSLSLDGLLKAVRQIAAGRRHRDPAFMLLIETEQKRQTQNHLCPDMLYSYASGKPIIVNGERVLN